MRLEFFTLKDFVEAYPQDFDGSFNSVQVAKLVINYANEKLASAISKKVYGSYESIWTLHKEDDDTHSRVGKE